MVYKFRSGGQEIGEIKIVEPTMYRGVEHITHTGNHRIHLTDHTSDWTKNETAYFNGNAINPALEDYTGYNYYRRISEYNIYYDGRWHKPLSIIEPPRFSENSDSYKDPGGEVACANYQDTDINSLLVRFNGHLGQRRSTYNGVHIVLLNFGGDKQGHEHHPIHYHRNREYFNIDFSDQVNPHGNLIWRFKTNKYSNAGNTRRLQGDNQLYYDVDYNFHLNPGKVAILC